MSIESAVGLSFDHVFVLGLHASRGGGVMAGASGGEAIPAELVDSELAELSVPERARRLLYTAMTRSRHGLVLAFAARSARGSERLPSPAVEEARLALGGRVGVARRGAVRAGRGASLDLSRAPRRAAREHRAARHAPGRAALRHRPRHRPRRRALRELVKLASLLQRRDNEPVADALEDINARLGAALTPLQREVLQSSPLDELLLGTASETRARARATAAREEPTLAAFLPRRGDGLVLSASDVESYLTCPLRYKFARVLRIPREPTLNQRFGIVVHQVLERFHESGGGGAEEMMRLLETAWRRGGFADSDEERQLREKARAALTALPRAARQRRGEPRWFERSFNFPLGRHHSAGASTASTPGRRRLRADRLQDRPAAPRRAAARGRPARALRRRRARRLGDRGDRAHLLLRARRRARAPGIDDGRRRGSRTPSARSRAASSRRPSSRRPRYAVCSMCEYRIACPAAEK